MVRLKTLDLSNNCVSSIPPDLGGLNSLRDLNLAANDLVQFDQWRALDSLPSLQVLNLALNRVKRLQDDTAGGSGSGGAGTGQASRAYRETLADRCSPGW